MRKILVIALLLLGGCSYLPKPQKGGGASVGASAPAPTGAAINPKGPQMGQIPPVAADQPPMATITQPDNPNGSSTQETAFEKQSETITPSPYEERYETTAPDGTKTVVVKTFPAGTVRKESVKSGVKQALGGTFYDSARDIVAKAASYRPVQYFGMALILAALAMFHPVVRIAVGAGKQMQAITGAAGVGLILAPSIIAGHETLIILVVIAGLLVYFLSNRLAHKEALADHLLNSQNNDPSNK